MLHKIRLIIKNKQAHNLIIFVAKLLFRKLLKNLILVDVFECIILLTFFPGCNKIKKFKQTEIKIKKTKKNKYIKKNFSFLYKIEIIIYCYFIKKILSKLINVF